jgi:hypothetical protein
VKGLIGRSSLRNNHHAFSDSDEKRKSSVCEAVNYIYMMNNELAGNKNRTNGNDSNLSCQVEVIPRFAGQPPRP